MAAISGKPKPVLPPKPPRKLENVICDKCSSKERCPSHSFCHERSLTYLKKDPRDEAHYEETSSLRVITLRATEEETKLISNIERSPLSHESSVEVITEINKNVYKGENTKLITKKSSHKPPLLPKPPTLCPYVSRTKSILSPAKITSITKPITKCTETSPSTCSKSIVGNHSENSKQHTDTASKNLSLAYRRNVLCHPLSLQAPVAKLEEFDILYDSHNLLSPTRPPRIAKKLLTQGMLTTHSDNTPPELPAKKSLLSHISYQSSPKECSPTIRGGTTWSYWQIHKGKSASLGRAEGQTLRFGNSDRNKFECTEQDFIGESIFSSSSIKPIPPPRRRKKLSSDDSPTMDPSSPVSPLFINSDQSSNYAPIYATVNYEMKKSRRSASFGGDASSSTIGNNIGNLEIKQIKPHLDVTGMKTDITKSQESNSVPIEENICNHSSDNSLSINSSHYCEEKSSTCLLTETYIDNSKCDEISDSCNQDDNSVISNCVKIRSPLCEAHDDISCGTTDTPVDLVPSFFTSKDNTCGDSARKDLKNKNHNLESVSDLNSHSCSLTSYKVLPAQQNTLNTDSAFKEKVKLFCEHNNEMLCDSCLCYSSVNYNSSLTEIKYSTSLNNNATESLITQQPDRKSLVSSNCVNTTKDIPISICESESGSIESQHISNVEKKVKVSKSCHISGENSDHCEPSSEDYNCELSLKSNSLLTLLKDVSQNNESLECSSSTNRDVICATNTSLVISDPLVIVNASNVLATRKNVTRTFSLPLGTKVNMKESKKGIFRRQSWSNLKSSHSSSSDGGINNLIIKNRKTRTHSFWCDEGELSSGALADVDSSDNAIKPYFFEESIDGSEVIQNPKQGRIASWFNTLSKGNKNKDKRDSLSRFYYDQKFVSHENIDNGGEKSSDILATNLKLNSPEEDVNLPVYNIHDVNRPASGLSDTLDFDQKSDIPLSEDSFDIGPHSDSENDDYGYTDAKDVLIEQKRDKKAFYIAHELMSSERIFIDVLKLLNIDFKNFVKQAAVEQKILIIPDEDLDKILNSLPQLQSLNEDFLHDLEDRISNWSSNKKMADVIVRIGPFLKLYTSYIQNFETQCSYLDECCIKYPKFAKVLKDFEATPRCQKLSLKHYMLKPIQRIPQYRLLLDDYLRNLFCESPDYEDTKTALKIVCDVADHANRSLKLGDNLRKLLQLQSQLGESDFEVIKPGRVVIREGELFKLSRKVMQPRYFILLNDCLLYTSYYGGSMPSSGLKLNYVLSLTGMKVFIPKAEDYQNEFSIISTTRSFMLSARSLEEQKEWVKALKNAIKENESRQLTFKSKTFLNESLKYNEESPDPFKLGREAPVWIQDHRVTRCQSCTKEFTVTFRRHHCRACGKVVCGSCSDNRAPLEYKNYESARVCSDCYDTLLKEFEDSEMIKGSGKQANELYRVRARFKKSEVDTGKKVKYVPQRLLEVTANDTGSQLNGWLQKRTRRSWKRYWFVLKEQVLYAYKASEDVVALESIPVLGYKVVTMNKKRFELYEGVDAKLIFQLEHKGQSPLVFHADNEHMAARWISAMLEATVLK